MTRRRSSRSRLTLLALSSLCGCGCGSESTSPVGRTEAAIELAERRGLFDLSSSLDGQRSRIARERATVALATGALFSELQDKQGQPLTSDNGVALRSSCGIAFVSPSYAITAAHCVDGTRASNESIAIELYRPHPLLGDTVGKAAVLSGSFPDFTHERLTESDGYFVERYVCSLSARCAEDFGGWLGCDGTRENLYAADIALLHCDGTPGIRYGHLKLATVDEPGASLFMPWKHELYDVPMTPDDDRFAHYARLNDQTKDNYHYFGKAANGTNTHQLLPLMSVPFESGAEHHKVAESDNGVLTDLLGCHGTSGSGVLQADEQGNYSLLGPAIRGNHELLSYLCNHSPAYDGFSRDPGCSGIIYGKLAATRELLAQWEDELIADCEAAQSSLEYPLHPQPCGISAVPASINNALSAAQPIDWAHPGTLANQPYRVGLIAKLAKPCSAGCGTLTMLAGTRELTRYGVTESSPSEIALSTLYRPTLDAEPITVRVEGDATLTIEALYVVAETERVAFDSAKARQDVKLVDLDVSQYEPLPLRVVGEKDGFLARILPRERLVFPRLALVPGNQQSVSFSTKPDQALRCGLLSNALDILSVVDCSAGRFQITPPANSAQSAVALYIDNVAPLEPFELAGLFVASSTLPDRDGDTFPDVADPCPDGPRPKNGEPIEFAPLWQETQTLCTPEPKPIAVTLPSLRNACEPARIEGHLTGFPALRFDATAPELSLPQGLHSVTFTAFDALNNALAEATSRIEIQHEPSVKCCSENQTLRQGTAADDSYDYSTVAALCSLTRSGKDRVWSGLESDYIALGTDDDYVYSAGGNDVFLGGPGDDVLLAGSAVVQLFGGAGDDKLFAEASTRASVYGGPGRDVLVSGAGNDRLFPGSGGDWVFAGAGDDEVRFYDPCELASRVTIYGGDGHDRLISPFTKTDLVELGHHIENIEEFVVDSTLRHFSDCFTLPEIP